jgi:hypothetical protein
MNKAKREVRGSLRAFAPPKFLGQALNQRTTRRMARARTITPVDSEHPALRYGSPALCGGAAQDVALIPCVELLKSGKTCFGVLLGFAKSPYLRSFLSLAYSILRDAAPSVVSRWCHSVSPSRNILSRRYFSPEQQEPSHTYSSSRVSSKACPQYYRSQRPGQPGSSAGAHPCDSLRRPISEEGRNHTETWAGCIVSVTTLTRSLFNASRSVSSLSLAEKASRVFLASYLLL